MTKDYKTHYLSLKQFDDYIHSDSETMKTIRYVDENDVRKGEIKSEVHPKDILNINYRAKPTKEPYEESIVFDYNRK